MAPARKRNRIIRQNAAADIRCEDIQDANRTVTRKFDQGR
jgi:hypothetical protein